MCILNSCVAYKFQTVSPGCPPFPLHIFWLTAMRQDICAALYFCSCDLRWPSTKCVLLCCFKQTRKQELSFGGQNAFLVRQDVFLLYVLIKNFSGNNKIWEGTKNLGNTALQVSPVFTCLVLTRCWIFLQLWTALSYETADNICSQWHIVAYNNE